MTTNNIKKRLKYLREQIRQENISYGEIDELQSLATHISHDDVELLQWTDNNEELEDCGCCGGEHPANFTRDCRDDENRFPKS